MLEVPVEFASGNALLNGDFRLRLSTLEILDRQVHSLAIGYIGVLFLSLLVRELQLLAHDVSLHFQSSVSPQTGPEKNLPIGDRQLEIAVSPATAAG
jgi:hypothetical protein